MLFIWICL
jgi:tricorn protease-like protein